MNKKENINQFHMNIGSSSILLIFIILCLIAFAALSIVSANADTRLSNKVAERTQTYYTAHNQATAAIAELDRNLVCAYRNTNNESEYFHQTGYEQIYEFPISELQTLCVKARILYPQKGGDTFYEITSWQIVTTQDIEYENNMMIIIE